MEIFVGPLFNLISPAEAEKKKTFRTKTKEMKDFTLIKVKCFLISQNF